MVRSGASATSIFGETVSLPRGPHRLSREDVRSSQRTRLLSAMVELVADQGYGNTTITAIARRAGVSPNVFYEHFASREECFLAGYDAFIEAVFGRLEAVVLSSTGWTDFITGLLEAYLGLLEDEPKAAKAFLIEVNGVGGQARARRRQAYQSAAKLLSDRHRELRKANPELGPLPERAFLGFVHAARELACDELEKRSRPALRQLIPDLSVWIAASVEGAAAVLSQPAPSQAKRRPV